MIFFGFILVDYQTGLWEKYLVTGDWSQSKNGLEVFLNWSDVMLGPDFCVKLFPSLFKLGREPDIACQVWSHWGVHFCQIVCASQSYKTNTNSCNGFIQAIYTKFIYNNFMSQTGITQCNHDLHIWKVGVAHYTWTYCAYNFVNSFHILFMHHKVIRQIIFFFFFLFELIFTVTFTILCGNSADNKLIFIPML